MRNINFFWTICLNTNKEKKEFKYHTNMILALVINVVREPVQIKYLFSPCKYLLLLFASAKNIFYHVDLIAELRILTYIQQQSIY